MKIGVVADTHGWMRPEAISLLEGVEWILHAGDVGGPEVLRALDGIAPWTAIRGNIDKEGECARLPATSAVELSGEWFYVLHDLEGLDIDPAAGGFRVVVSGHTHVPSVRESGGVLYLNPGSVGPRRFRLPVSLAVLQVADGDVRADLIELAPRSGPKMEEGPR